MKIAWLTNNISQLGGIKQVICGLSSYFSTVLKHMKFPKNYTLPYIADTWMQLFHSLTAIK